MAFSINYGTICLFTLSITSRKQQGGHLFPLVVDKKIDPYNIPVNSGTPYGPIN